MKTQIRARKAVISSIFQMRGMGRLPNDLQSKTSIDSDPLSSQILNVQ